MLIDAHIHYDSSADPKKILKALEITNASNCCLQSLLDRKKLNQNIDSLYAKLICGSKVYVNAALDTSLYYDQEKMKDMPLYIKRMMDCGIDGIKLIEGKPTERKIFPIPDFDSPLFEDTFKFLEESGLNITWHVNDPEEFWDDKLVPDWARRSGWFYADGTFVNNLDQYKQIENLLKKHPNLSITFAHFFFLSKDLDHLSYLFDTYPKISIDITPGVELFTNLSDNITDARKFFIKYADRILYGTDITVDRSEKNSLNEIDAMTRKKLCHDFLTLKNTIIKGDPEGLLGKDDIYLNCLELPIDVVEKIEYKNFLRLYPVNHSLNIKKILEEIKIHRENLKKFNLDDHYLDIIESEFKKYDK